MTILKAVGMAFISFGLIALLCLCGGGVARAQEFPTQPLLVPQPREVTTQPKPFKLTARTLIVLGSSSNADDRFAAQSIQDEIKAVTGEKIPIVSHSTVKGGPVILLGRLDQASIARRLKTLGLSAEGVGEQGYVLNVDPNEIIVAGKDAAGLFYGVQTLRQLVVGDANEAQVLGVKVRDWPALAWRGTQVDMARGPVPKLEYVERIVRTIAEFKMNALFMYIEDSFPMQGSPLVGVLSDTLSQKDWKALVAYAAPYHVTIIPASEGCGHMHKIFRFEEFSGLAERPHGQVFAAGDPLAFNFLNQMYQQMTNVFTSPIYNVGCDETFELGLGRSAEAVQKQGYGEVYVDNLIQVHDLVRKFNKQVMFWGDIAVQHPEMIPRLPKDLLVASWEYSYHPSYDKWLKPFEGTGLRIFVCPWVGNTSLIMPDYEEAAANIGGFLADGKKAGAIGTDVTVWNDDGESLYGLNWWSIVYGAATAWEPGTPDVATFDQKFDWVFYRNTDHRFTQALKKLAHINEVIRAGGETTSYDGKHGGADDALFWHDPFSLEGQQDIQRILPVASQIRLTAEAAYAILTDDKNQAQRNADTLANARYAALKIDALAMRYQFMKEIAERYAQAVANQSGGDRRLIGDGLSNISSTNGRLQDLRDYTTRLTELYADLWRSENLTTWLPNMLQLYQRNSALWQAAIARFNQIRTDLYRNKKPLPPAESLGLLSVPQPAPSPKPQP